MACAPRITTPLSASVPIHARAGAKGTVFPVHPGNSGRPSWGLWPGSAVTFSGHTVTQCSGGDGGQCSVTSLHGISLTVMTLTVVTFHHCLKHCAPCSLCSPPPCPPRSGGLSPAEHGEHRIKGTQGAGHRTQRTQDTGNRGHRTLNMGHGTQDKGNRGHGTQGTRDTGNTEHRGHRNTGQRTPGTQSTDTGRKGTAGGTKPAHFCLEMELPRAAASQTPISLFAQRSFPEFGHFFAFKLDSQRHSRGHPL